MFIPFLLSRIANAILVSSSLKTRTIGEVKPTIDVVKKLAEALNTTVGYLLGESKDQNILKDQDMLKRLNDIATFSPIEKEHILFALDAMITKVKLKSI